MRVFHVLTHFMPRQVAGTEMYVYALQSQLQALGLDGGVIIPGFSDEGSTAYTYQNTKVYSYAQPAAFSDEEIKGYAAPVGITSFRQLLEALKPDVLHFHEISGANGITVFHFEVAKSMGIPLLFTMHLAGYVCVTGTLLQNTEQHCSGIIDISTCVRCSFRHQHLPPVAASAAGILSGLCRITGIEMYKRKGKMAGVLGRSEMLLRHRERLRQIASHCNTIVALNSWFASILLQNAVPPEKIKVVEQGLPFLPERNGTFSDTANIAGGPLRLVFVGRIYPAKGLHILLEALAACNPEDFSLDIYGPCNDAAYMRRCEGLVKPGYSVSFRGVIKPGETVRQLRDYHLLCLPSSVTEMAPLVIQEAFAAGIPVIASDVYGNEAFIKHRENGLLFECNKVVSLQQQLQACVEEPSLLKKLQQGITHPRSFYAVARDYLKLYEKLMISA
jgi:glycosyltransferase involved in cell wall biosynthesis